MREREQLVRIVMNLVSYLGNEHIIISITCQNIKKKKLSNVFYLLFYAKLQTGHSFSVVL